MAKQRLDFWWKVFFTGFILSWMAVGVTAGVYLHNDLMPPIVIVAPAGFFVAGLASVTLLEMWTE